MTGLVEQAPFNVSILAVCRRVPINLRVFAAGGGPGRGKDMESEALPHEYTVEKTAGSRGEATGAEGARYVLVPRCGSACLRGDHESLCSQVCREWHKGSHDSPPTSKPVRTLPNRQHAGEYIKVDAIRPERISGQTSGQLGPSIEIPVEGQWSRVYLDRLCAEGSTVSLTEEHYKDLVAQDRREVYWRCSCGTGHFVSAGGGG